LVPSHWNGAVHRFADTHGDGLRGPIAARPRESISSNGRIFADGPIGLLFYNLFPALGPARIFLQDFPWHPMTTAQAAHLLREPIAVKGVQNAIPSLHMAWVLLAWWYSRGLSVWERGIAMMFVVFTAFATLGTGEHYFIDLVVAYPFSVMMQSLCAFPLRWSQRERVTGVL
jgi:hypothetical protein